MQKMRVSTLLMLMVAAASQATLQEEEEGEYHLGGGKFLFQQRTTIVTILSTTTSVVGSSCLTNGAMNINPATCTGKRRRRGLKASPLINDGEMFGLESSQADESAAITDQEGNQEKLVFWTTTRTTIPIITFSTMPGNVLTVRFSCTIAGMVLPPLCG